MWCRDEQQGVVLQVLVQPRASRERIGPVHDDRLKVAVTAPPVDGAANAALIRLLARTFELRRADVVLRSGQSGRRKTLELHGIDAARVREKI
jgi:hypothetical protein